MKDRSVPFHLQRLAVFSCLAASTVQGVSEFLWLSDIHLDPHYGTLQAAGFDDICRNNATNSSNTTTNTTDTLSEFGFGYEGCDAPLTLLQSAVQNAASRHHPEFIVLTGDLVRHATDVLDEPVEEVRSTLGMVAQAFAEAFPDYTNTTTNATDTDSVKTSLIIPTIGNNDVTPDYYLNAEQRNGTNNLMLNNYMDALLPYFTFSTEEERTMRLGGYMARNISSHLTVLSINTLLYSSKHVPQDQDYIEDPLYQFDWLEAQLDQASQSNRSVYIVGHIAPTIGSFRKSQLWIGHYLKRYLALLVRYNHVVAAQLFGHVHSDEFRVETYTLAAEGVVRDAERVQAPLLMASAITPVYGCNPSYRVVKYASEEELEGKAIILDYETYYLELLEAEGTASPSASTTDTGTVTTTTLEPIPGGTRTAEAMYNQTDDHNTTNSSALSTSNTTMAWTKLYSFQQAYNVPNVTVSTLKMILTQLEQSVSTYASSNPDQSQGDNYKDQEDAALETFLKNLRANVNQGSCNDQCRIEWVCVLQSASTRDYQECLYNHGITTVMDQDESEYQEEEEEAASEKTLVQEEGKPGSLAATTNAASSTAKQKRTTIRMAVIGTLSSMFILLALVVSAKWVRRRWRRSGYNVQNEDMAGKRRVEDGSGGVAMGLHLQETSPTMLNIPDMS